MINSLKRIFSIYPLLVIIFVSIQFTKAVGFLPEISSSLAYLMLGVYAIITILRCRNISIPFAILLLYLPLNILAVSPDPLFLSWERLGAFVLLLMCTTPLLRGFENSKDRKRIFYLTLWISTVLSALSFFCYFLGINFMTLSVDVELTQAGVFGGLFNQSMMLGPLAGLSSLFMAYKGYKTSVKIYWIIMVVCIGAVFFSASRSALLSTVVSLVVMLYYISGSKGKFIKYLLASFIVLLLTFPLWKSATDLVLKKQTANVESGSVFFSRSSKWNNRIIEFSNSPIFGVGYAAMDVKHTQDYNPKNGVMEPGSSWLCILSMTGLVGLCIIIYILLVSFKSCKNSLNLDGVFILGCLAFICVHMIVEGYIFSAGSFLCYVAWLIIGSAVENLYLSRRIRKIDF